MYNFLQYYGRFQGLKGNVGGLPQWARMVLVIVALPGVVLIGLSIVAFLVSLLALLLLTVPVYRVLKAVCVRPQKAEQGPVEVSEMGGPRRHVEVTIVE
jgi:hypothetical protein